MKTYIFIYEDCKGNELERKEMTAMNIKEAKIHAKKVLANSMMGDLYKIKVQLK